MPTYRGKCDEGGLLENSPSRICNYLDPTDEVYKVSN